MLEPEDMAVDEDTSEVSGAHAVDQVCLVTMNVAGLCDALGPAAARMDEIFTNLLTDEEPDVLCFQEVTDDMYAVLRSRTSAAGDMRRWSLHRRRDTEMDYYVVTATKYVRCEGERATSRRLESNQGRHALTLTRQGMHFINMHAESGGGKVDRDCRASQLQYLARAHECADGGACFLAGDFNLRQGEDQVLLDEGWRDSARQLVDVEDGDGWTWARGGLRTRYDRVYTHVGGREKLDCLRCATLPGYIEAGLSDHKPVCVKMKRTDTRVQAAVPDTSMPRGRGREFFPADAPPGMLRVMNAAVSHVHAFRTQVSKVLREWEERHRGAEAAILAERGSSAWAKFVLKPKEGRAATQSSKAEAEILCRAAQKLHDAAPHQLGEGSDEMSDEDDEKENLELDEDEGVGAEDRKVRTLVRRLSGAKRNL
jgi:endonuclease/exonuclease/phosphatase family metal-dependent hydrolase